MSFKTDIHKCSVSKTGLNQPGNAFTVGSRSQPSIKAIINPAVLNVPWLLFIYGSSIFLISEIRFSAL